MIHLKTEAETRQDARGGSRRQRRPRGDARRDCARSERRLDLDAIAAQVDPPTRAPRRTSRATAPAGRRRTRASICASVNDEVVHGIPRRRHVLREGDIISIDCGAIVDGWHGDAAFTAGVGEIDPADPDNA